MDSPLHLVKIFNKVHLQRLDHHFRTHAWGLVNTHDSWKPGPGVYFYQKFNFSTLTKKLKNSGEFLGSNWGKGKKGEKGEKSEKRGKMVEKGNMKRDEF